MNISVFGLGHVGAVTAACLAGRGHRVIGVDVSAERCALVAAGHAPVLERGLEALIQDGLARGRLRATTSAAQAVFDTDLSIVTVGTPGARDGEPDLSFVRQVCDQIGQAVAAKGREHTVVIRSTVPPGTTAACQALMQGAAGSVAVRAAFNPEFMREGCAVADFDRPACTVIGADEPRAEAAVQALYAGTAAPVIVSSSRVAEMLKYATNTYHALKITFANEVGQLAKAMGIDGRSVMALLVQQASLGANSAYLEPGFAYGGSCLPKDVAALQHLANSLGLDLPLLTSLPQSNRRQIERAASRILESGARRVAVLGLAFKPGTNDLRESPSVALVGLLLNGGCAVSLYDPAVGPTGLAADKHHLQNLIVEDPAPALRDAEAVVVTHRSGEFERLLTTVPPEVLVFDLAGVAVPDHLEGDGVAW